MKIATRWSTARREYRCDEVNSWAHAGRIKPGDRYATLTFLGSDVLPMGYRLRVCVECAAHRDEIKPDPKTGVSGA